MDGPSLENGLGYSESPQPAIPKDCEIVGSPRPTGIIGVVDRIVHPSRVPYVLEKAPRKFLERQTQAKKVFEALARFPLKTSVGEEIDKYLDETNESGLKNRITLAAGLNSINEGTMPAIAASSIGISVKSFNGGIAVGGTFGFEVKNPVKAPRRIFKGRFTGVAIDDRSFIGDPLREDEQKNWGQKGGEALVDVVNAIINAQLDWEKLSEADRKLLLNGQEIEEGTNWVFGSQT